MNREKPLSLDNDLVIWKIQLDDYIAGLGWCFDDKRMYAASSAGKFYILNGEDGRILYEDHAHEEGLDSMAASPREAKVITAGKDGKIRMRNGLTGETLKVLEGGDGWVDHLAWSGNGKHFATASGKTLKIWTSGGDLLYAYNGHESFISALYWQADHLAFATACYGAIRLFNIKHPEPYQTLFWKTPMVSLTWSHDGKFLLAGTQDSRIQVWQLPYIQESEMEMQGYSSKVKELSWHVSGGYVATNCGAEIVIWDMRGEGPKGSRPTVMQGHVGKLTKVKFQRVGDLIASTDQAGLILIRHPNNKDISVKGASETTVCQMEWSYDDENLLFGTETGEVMLWETPF